MSWTQRTIWLNSAFCWQLWVLYIKEWYTQCHLVEICGIQVLPQVQPSIPPWLSKLDTSHDFMWSMSEIFDFPLNSSLTDLCVFGIQMVFKIFHVTNSKIFRSKNHNYVFKIVFDLKTWNILSGENQVVSFKNTNFPSLGFCISVGLSASHLVTPCVTSECWLQIFVHIPPHPSWQPKTRLDFMWRVWVKIRKYL